MALVSRRNIRLGWQASWLAIVIGVGLTAATAGHARGAGLILAGVVPTTWGIVVALNLRGASDYVPYRGLRDDWPPYFRRALGLMLGLPGLAFFIAGIAELFA